MSSTITINDAVIGDGQPTYIIAEIGINHNGEVEQAKKLIHVAVAAGCRSASAAALPVRSCRLAPGVPPSVIWALRPPPTGDRGRRGPRDLRCRKQRNWVGGCAGGADCPGASTCQNDVPAIFPCCTR